MAHLHSFDPVSGWCSGCGLRDDGRLTDSSRDPAKGGRVLREARAPSGMCPALSPSGVSCVAYAGPHELHTAQDGTTWRDWYGQRSGFVA